MANSMSVSGAGSALPGVPTALRRGLLRTGAFVVAFPVVAWLAELVV